MSFCSSETSPLQAACHVPVASSRESSQFGLWQRCGKRGKEGGAAWVREGGPGGGGGGASPPLAHLMGLGCVSGPGETHPFFF